MDRGNTMVYNSNRQWKCKNKTQMNIIVSCLTPYSYTKHSVGKPMFAQPAGRAKKKMGSVKLIAGSLCKFVRLKPRYRHCERVIVDSYGSSLRLTTTKWIRLSKMYTACIMKESSLPELCLSPRGKWQVCGTLLPGNSTSSCHLTNKLTKKLQCTIMFYVA